MNNAAVSKLLSPGILQDPAEHLLSSADPLPPPLSEQGSYTPLQMSGKSKWDLFQALNVCEKREKCRRLYCI